MHGAIPEGKTIIRGIDLPPTFSVEVKESVQLTYAPPLNLISCAMINL